VLLIFSSIDSLFDLIIIIINEFSILMNLFDLHYHGTKILFFLIRSMNSIIAIQVKIPSNRAQPNRISHHEGLPACISSTNSYN
jgi:hypothetical protein